MGHPYRPRPGSYARTLLRGRDGEVDTTSDVLWVQGDRLFCDVRFRRDASGERTFHMGFAGELADAADGAVEWRHEISAGEAFGAADVGHLEEIPGWGLLETGRDLDYVELWERREGPALPLIEARGEDSDGNAALLVQVGDVVGLSLAAGPGRPASVHVGIADGEEWVIEYSSTAAPGALRFRTAVDHRGHVDLTWLEGAPTPTDLVFHHQQQRSIA
jgi:hypothetical protein